ncbi:MAG: PAS domain S-box protein [Thermodesulfobacteriota bacterium]|nr:PAS domain S-box protein [Thermodesulfobacteriota bacterium]
MSAKPTNNPWKKRLKELEKDVLAHKKMEEDLRQSMEKYRLLFENASDPIFLLDTDFNFLDVNQEAVSIYGYTKEEFLNMKILDLTIPEQREEMVETSIKALEKKGLRGDWRKHITKDGRTLDIEFNASVINFNEKKLFISIISRDNTEKKRTQEALQESEKRFRDIAELLPQTIFEVDLEGNITFLNRNALASFGYTEEDLKKGLNASQMLIPEDTKRISGILKKMLKSEKVESNEYTALRKDGTLFPVIGYSSPIICENKPVGLRGVMIDITEQKQTERALRESEERYRQLVESSPFAITVHANGEIVFVNNVAVNLLGGSSPGELTGKKIFELLHPDYRDLAEKRIRNMYERKILAPLIESKLVRLDGQGFYSEIAAAPITY